MLFIPYMAITSAWAGGSLWPSQYLGRFRFIPEILFSLPFAYVLFPFIGYYAIAAAVWSFLFMQTGHANALPWGDGGHNPDRENTLSPVVKALANILGIRYYSINYARLFMAVKGLLITLPVGGLGLFFWPLGYELGHRLNKGHVWSELFAGAGAGLGIALFLVII